MTRISGQFDAKIAASVIAALLGVKLALLAQFGPLSPPDTAGYRAFADVILSGHLGDAGLGESAKPITLFRVIGYPALIAGADAVAGPAWPWLMVAGQIAASLLATFTLLRFCLRCGLSPRLAALASLAPALSLPLQLDQSLIPDSFYSSLTVLMWCGLAGALLNGKLLRRAAIAGPLLALAFLLREATSFLVVGLLPLIAIVITQARAGWSRKVLAAALILVPLFAVQQGYRAWNRERIGLPAITTGAQTTLFQALLIAARHDPTLWDGDDPLDQAARESFHSGDFSEVLAVNDLLFERFGMNAVQISAAAYGKYFASWRTHPLAMLSIPWAHMRANQAEMWFSPGEALRNMVLWRQDPPADFPKWSALIKHQGAWWWLPALVLDGLCKAMSVVVFAAFLLLTPFRIATDRTDWRFSGMAFGLWALYLAFFGIYGLVHLETRYMAPVVPASSVLGVLNLLWAARRWPRQPLSSGIL